MGSEKVALIKTRQERVKATEHLLRDLQAMEMMLEHEMFESGIQRIGVEQELSLIGHDWKPAPLLMKILEKVKDPRFTTEFACFNMEINLDPVEFSGSCFKTMENELWRLMAKGEKIANEFQAHLLLVGIVPTMRRSDIDIKNITPRQRYKDLLDALHQLRGDSFEFKIQGIDQWISRAEDSFFESSNTSFQVHYQVEQNDFVDHYNWALAITAPLLAASPNSPLLLGKRLWKETRIALFQQSVDIRSSSLHYHDRSPRVGFGNSWIHNSVLDLYRDDALRHKLILASTREEDAVQVLEQGGVPNLYALNIHNGTIYNWNRPCYGITEGKPHIRIENRVLPSGPTIIDEVANAAFWLGLMKGMPDEYRNIQHKMSFTAAKRNFHCAARQGLECTLHWMNREKAIPADELILKELLPIARSGLEQAHVDQTDIDRLLGIIEARVSSGRTGAQWMLQAFEKLQEKVKKDEALIALTAGISKRQQKGNPVHTWDLPDESEAGDWQNRYQTIEQIMSTELFTVYEDDPVELVMHMMKWRNIRHIPVENERGELTGLISSRTLIYNMNGKSQPSVKDVMSTNLVTINPVTSIKRAIEVMRKENVGCLPVVLGNQLVGIVTEKDFMDLAGYLMQKQAQAL